MSHSTSSKASTALLLGLVSLSMLAVSCTAYNLSCPGDYVGATKILGTNPTTMPTSGPASQPATAPALADHLVPPTGPIKLDVATAILLALSYNKDLIVEKFNPPIRRTAEQAALAEFDPTISGTLGLGKTKTDKSNLGILPISVSNTGNLFLGLSEFLPTGTQIDLGGTSNTSEGTGSDRTSSTRFGLGVTQSLLRGFGTDVNLATLRQTCIDTRISLYELRGVAQSIVAQTEQAYWDYTLAQRQIEIVTDSLDLAKQQLYETDERIRVGRLAPTERAAAEAEVAVRNQELIAAKAALDKAYLVLMKLISPPGADTFEREIVILQQPSSAEIPIAPLKQALQLARQLRPELNQARLQINRNELEIVKTANGLLPKLDLFATLGKTGFARTIGGTFGDFSNHGFDAGIGVNGEFQLTNRSARATYTRSILTRDQALEALANLDQTVEVDVRNAYVEVDRARQQVVAAAATERLQEVNLQSEQEKFRLNKSTSLQVAQVQRDLLNSQIIQVQAVASYLKAIVELYRLDGTLLQQRGITAPGTQPVQLTPLQK